ncbi:MAG: amidohydrolase family protein [Acidimicrobiales bacterium]
MSTATRAESTATRAESTATRAESTILDRTWIVDSDTHVTEPADVWSERVPRRFRDSVPKFERNEKGQDVWSLEGEHFYTVGVTAMAGWRDVFPNSPATLDECHPASYDAAARVKYMDDNGIWAQVIYPNVAGFGSQRFLQIKDDELKLICVRAYNDWLRDWVSVDPKRYVTVISTPFWDIDATIAEVERGIDSGHKGVLFTGEPSRFGLPHLGDPHWDPLWSLAQEAQLPIHFHIGSGDTASTFTPDRLAAHGSAATYAYSSVSLFLGNGKQIADLLTSGVLPRFPDLKFVSVESGIGFIPFVLEAVDYSYLEGRKDRTSQWDLMPSEYFARQVYSCFWFEQYAPTHMFDTIPVDNVLFETDFPHPTCLYGNIRERVAESLGAQSEAVQRKILCDNAAKLYRLDVPAR